MKTEYRPTIRRKTVVNAVKRPPIARSVGIPKTVRTKVEAIRRLTEDVNRIVGHLGANILHSRDMRVRIALERKVNQRGRLLNALLEQSPEEHQTLVREIKGGRDDDSRS